jgi:predicted transcriptional regulator
MDINIKELNVDNLIKISKALDNNYRRKIIEYCITEHSISEVKKKINLTYANIHKHIKILEFAGLIKTKLTKNKRGKIVLVKSLYKISKQGILEKV